VRRAPPLEYRASTNCCCSILESRILHGFVALDQGPCGLHLLRLEGHRRIGDAFATGHRTMSDATRRCLTHVLAMCNHSPAVDRVSRNCC